jgi:hypothetical protein
MINSQDLQHNIIKEIGDITNTIVSQNYFQFNKEYYKQKEGPTVEAPTSTILDEIFLQLLEHDDMYHILIKHKGKGYFRYNDNIVIIHNEIFTNINHTLRKFIQSNLHFTMEFTWEQILLDKPPVAQSLKNFQIFYGTQRFITMFTKAIHWFLSSARSIQAIAPPPSSLRSILIYYPPTYVYIFLVVSFILTFPPKFYILSRVLVTIDRVWIGNWIY